MRASAALRLQIHRRLEAAIHIERHRGVQMRDLPFTALAAKADGIAGPEIDDGAVDLGTGHVTEAVGESDIAAGCDRQIAELDADAAAPGLEPRFDAGRVPRRGAG